MPTFNSNYTLDNFNTMCLIPQIPVITGFHETQTLTNTNIYGVRYNDVDYYFLGGKILYKHIMRSVVSYDASYEYDLVVLTDRQTKFSNILEALQSNYVWIKNTKDDGTFNVNYVRSFSGAFYIIYYHNANGQAFDTIDTSLPFDVYTIERL